MTAEYRRMSEMPDFSEYLDSFDAICNRCNVTHDLLREQQGFLDKGCQACHAPREVGFKLQPKVKSWVHSADARVDIEQRILKGIAELVKVPPGVSIPVETTVIVNIEERPNRVIVRDPTRSDRIAFIDFPTGVSEAVLHDYRVRFANDPAIFESNSNHATLKLFEEVHQGKRQIATGSLIEPAY
jgi:hypothetical protein